MTNIITSSLISLKKICPPAVHCILFFLLQTVLLCISIILIIFPLIIVMMVLNHDFIFFQIFLFDITNVATICGKWPPSRYLKRIEYSC